MGAEESQRPKGVDIGQDMVPLFSEHMGGEAEKRWIILHDKDYPGMRCHLVSDPCCCPLCGRRVKASVAESNSPAAKVLIIWEFLVDRLAETAGDASQWMGRWDVPE